MELDYAAAVSVDGSRDATGDVAVRLLRRGLNPVAQGAGHAIMTGRDRRSPHVAVKKTALLERFLLAEVRHDGVLRHVENQRGFEVRHLWT